MSKGVIYCAHCLVNGKKYIGQTKQEFQMRIYGHKRDSKLHNVKFYRAIKKYGWEKFIWGIVEECSVDELNEKEIFYIEKYNSYHNGYNSTLGGMNAVDPIYFSQYRLMSPSGEIVEGSNINKFCRDNKLTRATILLVLQGKLKPHKGWKLPETIKVGHESKAETISKEFILKSPTGKVIKGKNIRKFCRDNNLHYSGICDVISGRNISHRGWTLPETTLIGGKVTSEKLSKEFQLVSPDGKIIKGKNISKFCKYNDLDSSHISKVILGKIKSHKGWTLYK